MSWQRRLLWWSQCVDNEKGRYSGDCGAPPSLGGTQSLSRDFLSNDRSCLVHVGPHSWTASLWAGDVEVQISGRFASIWDHLKSCSSFRASGGSAEASVATWIAVELLCDYCFLQCLTQCISKNLLHRNLIASMSVSRKLKLDRRQF